MTGQAVAYDNTEIRDDFHVTPETDYQCPICGKPWHEHDSDGSCPPTEVMSVY